MEDENQILKISDVCDYIKSTDLWANVSRKGKQGGIRKFVLSKIDQSTTLKQRYTRRKMINLKAYRNILTGVKRKALQSDNAESAIVEQSQDTDDNQNDTRRSNQRLTATGANGLNCIYENMFNRNFKH